MTIMNENVNKNLNFFLPKNVLREFWEMEEDTLMKTKAVIWILKKSVEQTDHRNRLLFGWDQIGFVLFVSGNIAS